MDIYFLCESKSLSIKNGSLARIYILTVAQQLMIFT